MLSWLRVILEVMLLFGAAIFVHEFGHFLVARWRGLKVEGFSIGFGPKIIGWQRDGIQYAWRWIPAGGYVKLPQMVTSEALEGPNKETALPSSSPGSRILVALAGPLMNLLLAFILAGVLYFVGLPIQVNPAIVGEVQPDSTEAKMGLRPGDRLVSVAGKTVTSWEDAQMTAAMAPTNVLPVVIDHNGIRTTYYLQAKVNPQLGLKVLALGPANHPVIDRVSAGSPAETAGLKKGDEVLEFAGQPIVGEQQLIHLIKDQAGRPVSMVVRRGHQHRQLTVTPRSKPAPHEGLLGVQISPSGTSVYQLQKPGPLPWDLMGQVFAQTFGTLGALFHAHETGVGVKDLSGPPGILAMLAAEVKVDYRLGLKFMVLLNISLAIFNLLPLPVLDGGHIAMALVEKLRGRPLSPRLQDYATTAFALLLISFMVYVSYNDLVKRLPLFETLLNQQVEIQSGATRTHHPGS